MSADLLALAGRCEAATGYDRELACEICEAAGLVSVRREPPFSSTCEPVLSDLLTAAKLVPSGMTWLVSYNPESSAPYYAAVERLWDIWDAGAADPSAALCAAALRARAA